MGSWWVVNQNGTAAGQNDGTQILRGPGELDLATAGSQYRRDDAAIRRHIRLLVLDLTGLSFCETCGLSDFARIASKAETAGCCHGLIAPQPLAGKTLRVTGLHKRLQVFATIDEAAAPRGPGRNRVQPLAVGGCASGTGGRGWPKGSGRGLRHGDRTGAASGAGVQPSRLPR